MDLGADRVHDVPQDHAAAARARHPQRCAARLRPLDRRLRDHVLRRRPDDDVPALRLGCGARLGAAAGQRDRERDLPRGRARHDRQRPLGPAHAPPRRRRGGRRAADDRDPGAPRCAAKPPRDDRRPTCSNSRATTCGCTSRAWAGTAAGQDVPIIVQGDGCYLWDANGKRYLDALAGLFSVNIGYGFGEEIGQAALEQMRELPFYTNWSYAHPKAIELAAELASLAPGDLNRVFFVSGGSEAVESAWKLARQYYAARGEKQRARRCASPRHGTTRSSPARRGPHRYKAIARHIAYHGTTMGALSINGIPALRTAFEPLVPEVRHVHNTNRYHRRPSRERGGVHAVPARRPRAGDPRDGPGDGLPRPHGAGAERGRLLHAARRLLAGRARDLRRVRHPALRRRGDHRLRPPRLLVRLRALRHPARHRHAARRASRRPTARSAP